MKFNCSKCGHENEIKNKGHGASYVSRMKRVPRMTMNILKWWTSITNPMESNKWMTKREIYHKFIETAKTSPDYPEEASRYPAGSVYARISELVGLGIMDMAAPTETSHSKKPRYRIDINKARKIIKSGGVL